MSFHSPIPSQHTGAGLEGQTHWKEHNVLGTILCDLWVGFFWVHQELFTFHVFVQSPYPQTSVLAPPMSSMALDLYEPRLLQVLEGPKPS